MTHTIVELFPRYEVTFDRIGRNHAEHRIEVRGDPDMIAEAVFHYARKFLISQDVQVSVDLEEGTVHVFAGMQTGASGLVRVIPDEVQP